MNSWVCFHFNLEWNAKIIAGYEQLLAQKLRFVSVIVFSCCTMTLTGLQGHWFNAMYSGEKSIELQKDVGCIIHKFFSDVSCEPHLVVAAMEKIVNFPREGILYMFSD